MYCCDTGEIPTIVLDKMTHVPNLSVDEAVDISKVLGVVRSADYGNGEIYIPLVNGLFETIRFSIIKYREKVSKKRKRLNT